MNRKTLTATAAALTATAGLALGASAHAAPLPRYDRPLAVQVPAAASGSLTVTWEAPVTDAAAKWEVLAFSANDPQLPAYAHLTGISGDTATVTGLPAGTAVDVKVTASADAAHRASGWTVPLLAFTTAAASGEPGPQGPKGDAGPAGKDGTVGDILHNSFGATAAANGFTEVAATCAGTADAGLPASTSYATGGDAANGPATGYVAVGGGYSVGNGSGTQAGVDVTMSRDELTYTAGRGWLVAFDNTTASPVTVRAWVVCALAPADNPNT